MDTARKLKSRKLQRLIGCIAVLFIAGGSARADSINVGALSYDTYIPASGGSPGVFAFNLSNLTGGFSLAPDFPVTDSLTFGSAKLTLTLGDLSRNVISLGDLGPGFLLDLNGNPIVQVPGNQVFDSAEFTATLSPIFFTLSNGTSFVAGSSAIDVLLLPSTGPNLTVDTDQTIITALGTPPATVPEPSGGLLLLTALLVLLGLSKRSLPKKLGYSLLSVVLLGYRTLPALAQNPVAVTLSPTTSPAAGQPGVTSVSVTGSGFPAGSIPAANVTLTLKSSASNQVTTTAPTAVSTVAGSTRRLTFTIPASVSVTVPVSYTLTLSGNTTAGTAFASSNAASLTVNPAAAISTLAPVSGRAGQTLSVTITGQFSNFLQGSTRASFGVGITTNSTAVASATQATANITIAPTATAGPRTVTLTTGLESASLASGFAVTALPPAITDFTPKSAPAGSLITVTGANLQPASGSAAQLTLANKAAGRSLPLHPPPARRALPLSFPPARPAAFLL